MGLEAGQTLIPSSRFSYYNDRGITVTLTEYDMVAGLRQITLLAIKNLFF